MKCKTQIVVISPKNTRRFRSNEFHQNSFFFDDIGALLSLQPGWCSKNGKPTCSKNATKLPATKNGKNVHATTKTCKQIIFLTAKTTPISIFIWVTHWYLIKNRKNLGSIINWFTWVNINVSSLVLWNYELSRCMLWIQHDYPEFSNY